MEIVWLNTEVDAIHYVYDYAVPKQIPLDTFEKFVRSSKEGTLPEFYVISENGKYIGYILLLADKKEDIPKPFTFLALLYLPETVLTIAVGQTAGCRKTFRPGFTREVQDA